MYVIPDKRFAGCVTNFTVVLILASDSTKASALSVGYIAVHRNHFTQTIIFMTIWNWLGKAACECRKRRRRGYVCQFSSICGIVMLRRGPFQHLASSDSDYQYRPLS
jgi:hypothetical protein